MPIGTKKSTFITQAIIDKLAKERSWPREHRDWPEYLWRIEIPRVDEHSSKASPSCDSLPSSLEQDEGSPILPINEIEEDGIFGDEGAKEDDVVPTLTTREDVDRVFTGKGAVFGFDVFKVTICKRPGGVVHRGALVRSGGNVFQLWDGPKTRQRRSVLGRIGSIGIICEGIEQELLLKRNMPKPARTSDLARFVSGNDLAEIKSAAKLLDRVNHGCFVEDLHLARICSRLGLTVEDVAFVHPTIFVGANTDRGAAYAETRSEFPPQLPAIRWIGSELELYERIVGENGHFKLEVKNLRGLTGEQFGGKIKFIIETCWRHGREEAPRRLIQLSDDMARAGLAAWVSFIAGSGDGDPEGRAKLIITIDNEKVDHKFIRV
jgi:hypothetical protein